MSMGNELIRWRFKRSRGTSFWYTAGGVLAALILSIFLYGEAILPWLKKVPVALFYFLPLVLGPLSKYLGEYAREREYVLYQNGFRMFFVDNSERKAAQDGKWLDYQSCTFDKKGVILQPHKWWRGKVRLLCSSNIMGIYSTCRERISLTRVQEMQKKITPPPSAHTYRQRR